MCLANGASKIVTIDYQPIKTGHENIIYLNAFDFVKKRNKWVYLRVCLNWNYLVLSH